MDDWLKLLILVLGTWRVARMVVLEDGPFDLFTIFRARIGQRTWVGRGFHCVLCLSFWLALIAALAGYHAAGPLTVVLIWLGIAGGVSVVFDLTME